MLKWILLVLTLLLAWYMWREDKQETALAKKETLSQVVTDKEWCEVKKMDCGDLTRMLNSLRPGRYFEATAKLLDTSFEDMTMLRENNNVTFLVTGGVKLIHNQSGSEKGKVTVIFSDGYTMKYDKKGKLISAH